MPAAAELRSDQRDDAHEHLRFAPRSGAGHGPVKGLDRLARSLPCPGRNRGTDEPGVEARHQRIHSRPVGESGRCCSTSWPWLQSCSRLREAPSSALPSERTEGLLLRSRAAVGGSRCQTQEGESAIGSDWIVPWRQQRLRLKATPGRQDFATKPVESGVRGSHRLSALPSAGTLAS